MNRLTAKQKRFAELVAEGKTYAQAFREAYDCSGSKPSTIRTDASRLARHPKIRAHRKRLEEIKQIAAMGPRPERAMEWLALLRGSPNERDVLKAAGRLARLWR